MSIKPYKILLFLSAVMGILLFIAFAFPKEGIPLCKNSSIRFASVSDIFSSSREAYANIDEILSTNELLNDSLLAEMVKESESETWDTVRANADSLRNSIPRLQFLGNNRKILYSAFKAFDQAATANQPVRIMHYGDSQIENDRITGFLRYKLQKKFGGMGPGMLSVVPMYEYELFTVRQEYSEGWYRYPYYWSRDTTVKHKRYGAMASFCRYTPYPADSTTESVEHEEWVSFTGSSNAYPITRTFQQCRVFYGYNPKPFLAEIAVDDVLEDADIYAASSSIKTIDWIFDQPVSNARITFRGSSSPDIYGIALDGLNGIAVDNIAMRGNAGLIFTSLNKENLRQHYEELNIQLIILQFGGNIVPDVTDKYISYYERRMYQQIIRIKEILPGVPVIVIGVSDMSIKEKTRYVSYPRLDKVRDALKNASFRADAAYWDLYEAMGGSNSMPSWVFADPPLASKDFVHFNPRGIRIISNMFYNALIYEYSIYKRSQEAAEN